MTPCAIISGLMVKFRDYDDVPELIERCVSCDEEIEPGTVEYCVDCLAFTHGDECLRDHQEICVAALPPRIPARSDRRKVARTERKVR
jgi:hypothetical protein